MRRRSFSDMTLEEAMPLIAAERFIKWQIDAPARPPSDVLAANLRRMQRFDTVSTEAAKLLLIDALLAECIEAHEHLKIWKGEALVSATLTGFADYLITPDYAFVKAPLLCAAEAKRDDFKQGRAQCVGELAACREKNTAAKYDLDLFGFVSNGQIWQFYKLTTTNEIFETAEYTTLYLPQLLGALDYICAECAKRVP